MGSWVLSFGVSGTCIDVGSSRLEAPKMFPSSARTLGNVIRPGGPAPPHGKGNPNLGAKVVDL